MLTDSLGLWLKRTFDSLGSRDFLFLWVGVLLSMGGFQMQALARSLLAYEMTADPWITSVVGVGWAPSLTLLSLFGGVISDRLDRRSVIVATQWGMALSTTAITVLLYLEAVEWWHLFVSSFGQGGMFALQAPARFAAVPQLVSARRTSNALALLALAATLMTMVAPAAAGVIYSAAGARGAFATISLLLLTATIANTRLPRLPPTPARSSRRIGGFRSAVEGLRFVIGNRTVVLLLLHLIAGAVLAAPIRFLINVPAEELLNVGPSGTGALLAASGIGGIAATLFVAGLRRGQRRGMVALVAGIAAAAAVLVLAATRSYVVALAAMLVLGLGELAPRTLATSLIVELAPDELRARVSGVTVLAFASTGVGHLGLGALMQGVGVGESLWLYGVAFAAVASGYLASPSLRRLR